MTFKAYIPLRRKTPNATLLHPLTQNIPTCWYILALPNAKICVSPNAKLKICVSPDANPRRQSMEYRWRWAFWRWGWRSACTFHIFCVDFICVWCPTRTPFPVEYGLKAYITLGVFFVLRWQLSPTQMKCTCNANDSTYILLGLLIKMRHI